MKKALQSGDLFLLGKAPVVRAGVEATVVRILATIAVGSARQGAAHETVGDLKDASQQRVFVGLTAVKISGPADTRSCRQRRWAADQLQSGTSSAPTVSPGQNLERRLLYSDG